MAAGAYKCKHAENCPVCVMRHKCPEMIGETITATPDIVLINTPEISQDSVDKLRKMWNEGILGCPPTVLGEIPVDEEENAKVYFSDTNPEQRYIKGDYEPCDYRGDGANDPDNVPYDPNNK